MNLFLFEIIYSVIADLMVLYKKHRSTLANLSINKLLLECLCKKGGYEPL